MPNVLLISGSPTEKSKCAALLDHAARLLTLHGATTSITAVRDFPADELLWAKYDSPVFNAFKATLAEADAVIVATPIYKAAYTGALKALLDILPQKALSGKTVLPIATGGTLAHLLAIDYALNPVLAVLGASRILQGIYLVDSQFQYNEDGSLLLDADIVGRFDAAVNQLMEG